MKVWLQGRSLGVDLAEDSTTVVSRLVDQGLPEKHVQVIASAAIQYAAEETEKLGRQLIPAAAWPGTVICRRHNISGRPAWLILKRGASSWNLDSALFD